jgi:hypothetical protein
MIMTFTIDDVWRLTELLNYGGIAVAISGVAVFGWTFVKLNAIAAARESNTIPAASWRGRSAWAGVAILTGGVAMQILGYVIAVQIPLRT